MHRFIVATERGRRNRPMRAMAGWRAGAANWRFAMIPLLTLVIAMSPTLSVSPGDLAVMAPRERLATLQATLDRYTVPHPPKASSVQQWEQRKQQLRRIVLDCLGLWPLPERVPLNVRVSAERPGDGYTLKRIYWQVYPDVYASGWLYMPDHINGKAPAVLCPHGHWSTGARHPTVQTRCIVLAQKGYVVLAVDSVHLDDYRVGVNPVGLMTWNNIRAVDLLCSIPEVDPDRIGCTGASGGGQQTMYMMAVEPRIAAAAPTVMMSYFFRIIALSVAHCYCNHVPSLARYTDEPEMCAAFAPKPALYMCDTRDWTRWFPHEGFPEIERIYRLYGAQTRVECHQWDVGHDYTKAMRETMYRFFDRWLKGIDHPIEPEPPVKTLDPAEMLKMGPNSPTAADMPKITADYMARRAAPPRDWTATSPAEAAKELRPAFADLVGEPLGGEIPLALEDRGEIRERGLVLRRIVYESEPGIKIPAVVAEPPVAAGPLKPAVLACPGGKATALAEHRGLVEALVSAGLAVVIPDYRFTGELAAKDGVWLVHGILWGRPVAAMTARDIRAAARVARGLPETTNDGAAVIAIDAAGVPALLAAAIDDAGDIAALACQRLGPTYRSGNLAYPAGETSEIHKRRSRPDALAHSLPPVIPNVLKVGDLPEMTACALPRPLLLGGVEDEQAFSGLVPAGLRIQTQPLSDEDIARWAASL